MDQQGPQEERGSARSADILPFVMIRAAAAALCVVVALVGCSSDEPEPEPLPPVPTISPTPVTLPLPSEAAAETPDGAAAFARYYLAVLEQALATGEAEHLRSISDEECGSCRNLIGAVEDADTQGQLVRDAGFVVEFAEAPPVEQGEVVVELRYRREAGELVDARGEVVEPIAPEGPVDAQMRLRRVGQSWTVLGFRQVTS